MSPRRRLPCPAWLLTLPLLGAGLPAWAETCPPAGARYILKGFTGPTGLTSLGGEADPRWGCRWKTEDGRDLSWRLGEDLVPDRGPAPSTAPPAGRLQAGSVYRCTLPGIGLFSGAYFGILDASRYRNVDGKTGGYRYDERSGLLELHSGPSKGLRYRRMPEGNFRVLDEQGALTGGNCTLNPALKIDGRW